MICRHIIISTIIKGKEPKMIRKIIMGFVILLVILCAAIVGIYLYAGEIIKTGVEKFLPDVTQTDVKLNHVEISLLKGHVGIWGLSIGNPKGYGAEDAFALKQISVSFEPKSVLTDKIIINQILIDGTRVDAEAIYQGGKITSNLTQIQKNVESYLAKTTSKAQQKPTQSNTSKDEDTSSAKQVVIRDLQINNSELSVGIMKQVVTASLPNIQQKNIGEQGKKTTWKDAIAYIFNLISVESVKGTATAVQDALRNGALQLVGTATETVNTVKESAKSLVDETTGNALNSVKGLFGK